MSNIGESLNTLLHDRNSKPVKYIPYSLDKVNDFLKEAYGINSRIAELVGFLRSIRRAYLSTAPPPRKSRFSTMAHSRKASRESQQHEQEQYLTDAQRDSIDTEAKATSRDIAAAITRLSQAEKVRRQAEDVLVQKRRRKKGFGALGSWAAGGGPLEKSAEEKMEDSKMMTIAGSREGVIWYLQRGLEACGKVQSHMMEVRISREFGAKRMPKDNMAGADISNIAAIDRPKMDSASRPAGATADAAMLEEQEKNDRFMRELSPDQMQLFAEENKDLLKHYEDRLDQVRTAEKSLIEISELQSTLAGNLEIQSSNIDALVQDTDKTAENVKFGNKELRRASERRSTAKMVFYGTVSLCSFLIIWDLII